jgi:methyl-accepting chemotaxis protein
MAENQQGPYTRRRYFINRRLQGRFTIFFLTLGLFITLNTTLFVWHFSEKEFDSFIYRSHLSPVTPWEAIFPVMMKTVVAATTALVISAYVCTHLIFKRLSAKFSLLNNALRDIDRGNLTGADPDTGIKEINEPLKLFIETLRQDIISLQTTQKGMKNLVEKMEKAPEKVTLLHDIEDMGKAFEKKLSNCRLIAGD